MNNIPEFQNNEQNKHLTSNIDSSNSDQEKLQFSKLLNIMRTLRAPQGCPWDIEQTHLSLIKYLREESFEVIEAIYSGNSDHICEELGDLILQVVFHALIAEDKGTFTIQDVLNSINEKLIIRHPHVFDKDHVQKTSLEDQWDIIKLKNKKSKSEKSKCHFSKTDNLIDSWQISEQIQLMAASDKFDWDSSLNVLDKIEEECQELREALLQKKRFKIKEELSDLLFSVSNLARFEAFDMEELIKNANEKFKNRYNKMKELANQQFPNTKFKKITIKDKGKLWEEAKQILYEEQVDHKQL